MDMEHSLSRPSLDENQLLPGCYVQPDGTQVEPGQSFGSICTEIDFFPFPCAFETSQRHLDGTQNELEQSFDSLHSKIASVSNTNDFWSFPSALELPKSGVNGPGEPFDRSSTPPVSGATRPRESIPDYLAMKPVSEGHGACPSQPLGVHSGSVHCHAFAPHAHISSNSYQLLEPSRQCDPETSGLAQPSTWADSSGTTFSTAYYGHNTHLSPCALSLSQNSAAPSRAEMAIESAGSLLGQKSQVDCPDHEAIQPGTVRACLQCNISFKSISELGQHATKLQHGAFKCKCGQPFKRLDSLGRHLIKYQPGARQYSCLLCDRYEGEKAFTREDNLKQHLRVYHRVNSTKYGEYKKCYLKA